MTERRLSAKFNSCSSVQFLLNDKFNVGRPSVDEPSGLPNMFRNPHFRPGHSYHAIKEFSQICHHQLIWDNGHADCMLSIFNLGQLQKPRVVTKSYS